MIGSLFVAVPTDAMDFKEYAVNRATYINDKWCSFRPELSNYDKLSRNEVENRVMAIIYWSRKLNYMYPSIHPARIAKDMLALVELESGFVNWNSRIKNGERYGVLDNGSSFGVFSMQWNTAYYIAERNNWDLNDRSDEIRLINNPFEQAKYAIFYYYYQLQRKNGNRMTALMAYNSPSVSVEEEKWRNYIMNIWGRIAYHSQLMKERVNEYYDWDKPLSKILNNIRRNGKHGSIS